MYGTLVGLKTRLRVSGSGDDVWLTEILGEASETVDELSGHSWLSGVVTNAYGQSDVLLDEDRREIFFVTPLTSVTSVTNGDGVVMGVGSYVLLPRNGVNKQSILLKVASGYCWNFGDGDGEIQIAATWVVPKFVIEATYVIAQALYRRGEDGAVSLAQALGDARELLAHPYSVGAV